MKIRKATAADLERIMEIYRFAQDFMIRSGNSKQWGHFYPDAELIQKDIADGKCHILHDETGVHGVFALFAGEEPTYKVIEDGQWLNTEPYLTIHRLAGDGQVHGLFRCAVEYCKDLTSNIRIDTHEKNVVMQKQILKNGFQRCGTIHVANGSPRIAYQWTAQKNQSLRRT